MSRKRKRKRQMPKRYRGHVMTDAQLLAAANRELGRARGHVTGSRSTD